MTAVTVVLASCGGNDSEVKNFSVNVLKVDDSSIQVEISAIDEAKYFCCYYAESGTFLKNPKEYVDNYFAVIKAGAKKFPDNLEHGQTTLSFDHLTSGTEYAVFFFEVNEEYQIVGEIEHVIIRTAQIPEGAINGKFTVDDKGTKVYFSKGNLQAIYNGSSWSWSFAANQWDYIGKNAANTTITGNGTVSMNGIVDLFGWSTAAIYYGINNSSSHSDYAGDFVDWGNNPISNGGNQFGLYWSVTTDGSMYTTYYLYFNTHYFYPKKSYDRRSGYSVRLVKDVK